MGVTTDVCVHTTIREANDLGFECILVEDATNAATRANHNSAISMVRKSGGIFGATAPTAHILDVLSTLPDCYLYDIQVEWKRIEGSLKQVTVGHDGSVWGVNSKHEVFTYAGSNKWNLVGDVKLRQIDAVNKDNVWGVGPKGEIHNWNGKEWKKIPGALLQVSAGSDGTVWGINLDGHILSHDNGKWNEVSTEEKQFKQLDVASSKSIFAVNEQHQIFEWLPEKKTWQLNYGRIKQLSVGSDGTVIGVDLEDDIFKFADNQWTQIQGKLKQVSTSEGHIWGVNSKGEIFHVEVAQVKN